MGVMIERPLKVGYFHLLCLHVNASHVTCFHESSYGIVVLDHGNTAHILL